MKRNGWSYYGAHNPPYSPFVETVSQLEKMSFRTYVRNLKVLNLLKPRFLASLRNDTKMNCDTVSYKGGVHFLPFFKGESEGIFKLLY